jgi:translation initiation factor 2 subunit 1
MYYYNKKLPVIDDIVFVNIKEFTATNIYCELIEYNNINGFLLASELDNKRKLGGKIKAPEKQLNIMKVYPMIVLGFTKNDKDDTISVDLSYKKVPKDNRDKLLERFIIINKIVQLSKEFINITGMDSDIVYENTIWKLFDSELNEESVSIDFDKLYYDILNNPHIFTKYLEDDYEAECNMFIDNFTSRLTKSDIVMEQMFELMIHDEDAVTKLKDVLTYNNDNCEIVYISSPKYQILVKGKNEVDCDSKIERCIDHIKVKSQLYHSIFNLKDKNIVKKQEINFKNLKLDSP